MDPLLDTLNDSLNPAQREAAGHIDGPMLVLAGPGSGKTRVVTHRIANLLRQGVYGSQVLALTFTNKAAAEMRSRVERLAPGQPVWVSTFHRFGAKLLRQYADLVGLTPNYTIYDTSDSLQTLKRVIEAGKLKTMHYTPERIASAISDAKNKLITPDEFEPRRGSPLSQIVAEVYPAYQKRMVASSAVDFDDLLLHVAKLLHDQPDVRATLDNRFRYILVDEYQDTNHAQYVMVRALSIDHPNLAVTGDPDQSIYGWRGADIRNILQFESDFPEVRVVRLEQNYRSTKSILRVADTLIGYNRQRKAKSLHTDNPEGDPVALVEYSTQDEEARGVAETIAAGIAAGRPASDYAVFYRVNALSRGIERAFRERGIPYNMVRGLEFYQRKEIKDVLAYCQLINNPLDDQAVLRTINTPARGIGRKTVDRLVEHAYIRGVSLLEAAADAGSIEGLAARSAKKLAEYRQMMEGLARSAGGDMEEILGKVLEETGYRAQLQDSESEEDLNRLANIEELLTDARQFDEEHPDGGALEEYLENAWLVNDTDGWEDDAEKVTMMTLHAAKGLEFPVVFVVAFEHGLLPHERSSNDESQVEEERRLAFVGITRAKERLELSYAVQRDFRGQRRRTVPSSFLMELPRDQMDVRQTINDEFGWLGDDAVEFDTGAFEEESFDIGQADGFDEAQEEAAPQTSSKWEVAAAQVTTAAQLDPAAEPDDQRYNVPPDAFVLGMAVVHREHGPGKIMALSGSGKNRRATIRFATAGERRYVLAHTPIRPAGG
ncbi:MAG: UvrD-helicase domain-containing protein [Planctomycetota bacterium]